MCIRDSLSSAPVKIYDITAINVEITLNQWGDYYPGYMFVLTKDIKKKQPNVKFHCREKVFLAFAWLGLHGNHRISALWFNPLGKQQDQIDFEFSTDQPKIENWVSLKFRDASDQTNPFLSDFFSPQLNGQWQVKVFLDGNFLDTLRFEVRCG